MIALFPPQTSLLFALDDILQQAHFRLCFMDKQFEVFQLSLLGQPVACFVQYWLARGERVSQVDSNRSLGLAAGPVAPFPLLLRRLNCRLILSSGPLDLAIGKSGRVLVEKPEEEEEEELN